MKTIAIIDDDVMIGDMLEEVLAQKGYKTLRAYSGTEALLLLQSNTPDLILLDLMLPGLTGEELLPRICAIPVIVISAKGDIESKLGLLRGGAMDYLTKPFDTRELLARIEIQLKMHESTIIGGEFSAAGFTLLQGEQKVQAGEKSAKLTRTEYAILKLLMQNAGRVISKNIILDRICEDTPDCTERSLKQHISNLRKKLEGLTGKESIETVWGLGFKLNG